MQSKNIIKNRKQEKILLTSTEAISSQNTYFKTDKRLRRGIMGTIRNINIRITMRIKQINPFLNTKGRVGWGERHKIQRGRKNHIHMYINNHKVITT